MTQFTKTHGDFQAVFHQDTGAYTTGALNAVTSGVAVNVMGPKLDFITVTGNVVANFSGAQIKTIIDTVQQLALVYVYQYTSTTNDTYQVVGTQTAGTGETITNAGLFDASTSGNLFVKGDFTGIALNSGDSIQFTFKVQFS